MSKLHQPVSLINEQYFKLFSPIDDNFDIKNIKAYFPIAEAIWIRPIIGEPLHEELLSQVAENNVTEENSTLLLMMYPLLAFSITLEAMPFVSFHLSEVGLTIGHSENSNAAPVSGLNIVLERLRSTVETLKTHFKKWLREHSDAYPLYKGDDNCSCETSSCDGCEWVAQFYGGDINAFRRYMNANRPSTRLQVYSTKRRLTDLR